MNELADSIRVQGVLSPLSVRPLNERGFEIVAGVQRCHAAKTAEAETVPVRIVNLSNAKALEAQLVVSTTQRVVYVLKGHDFSRAVNGPK